MLLNGKRLTAASGEIQGVYGVNLDSIPFSAIERVEVLKDGASADLRQRRDRRRHQLHPAPGFPRRGSARLLRRAHAQGGGGEKWNATGTVGFGDLAKDKYNVFVSAYYQKAESLDQNKRSFSDSSVDLRTAGPGSA